MLRDWLISFYFLLLDSDCTGLLACQEKSSDIILIPFFTLWMLCTKRADFCWDNGKGDTWEFAWKYFPPFSFIELLKSRLPGP